MHSSSHGFDKFVQNLVCLVVLWVQLIQFLQSVLESHALTHSCFFLQMTVWPLTIHLLSGFFKLSDHFQIYVTQLEIFNVVSDFWVPLIAIQELHRANDSTVLRYLCHNVKHFSMKNQHINVKTCDWNISIEDLRDS